MAGGCDFLIYIGGAYFESRGAPVDEMIFAAMSDQDLIDKQIKAQGVNKIKSITRYIRIALEGGQIILLKDWSYTISNKTQRELDQLVDIKGKVFSYHFLLNGNLNK